MDIEDRIFALEVSPILRFLLRLSAYFLLKEPTTESHRQIFALVQTRNAVKKLTYDAGVAIGLYDPKVADPPEVKELAKRSYPAQRAARDAQRQAESSGALNDWQEHDRLKGIANGLADELHAARQRLVVAAKQPPDEAAADRALKQAEAMLSELTERVLKSFDDKHILAVLNSSGEATVEAVAMAFANFRIDI